MMKKVLVTGANRGISKEICQQLLSLGHFVIACGRDLGKLKSAFPQETNNIFLQVLDVNNEESVSEAAKKLQVKFSKIDVVINNAGIGVGNSDLDDVDIEEVKQIFETNFFGPMRVNKYFLPLLKKAIEGRIINISSGMGELDNLTSGYAGYRLSKAGLNAQTILLANELKGYGIKVNAMCPGWVKTDMGGSEAPNPVAQGADTAVFLALEEKIETGLIFRNRTPIKW